MLEKGEVSRNQAQQTDVISHMMCIPHTSSASWVTACISPPARRYVYFPRVNASWPRLAWELYLVDPGVTTLCQLDHVPSHKQQSQ